MPMRSVSAEGGGSAAINASAGARSSGRVDSTSVIARANARRSLEATRRASSRADASSVGAECVRMIAREHRERARRLVGDAPNPIGGAHARARPELGEHLVERIGEPVGHAGGPEPPLELL